jgi:hypothetical protein
MSNRMSNFNTKSIEIYNNYLDAINDKTLSQDEKLSVLTYHFESVLGKFPHEILWDRDNIIGWKTPYGESLNLDMLCRKVIFFNPS